MTHFTQKFIKNTSFLAIIAIFCSIFAIFSNIACNKNSDCNFSYTNDTSSSQKAAMIAFCTANNINYTIHSSGVLYQIITPGNATKPNACSSVSASYTGTYLNNNVFNASAAPVDFSLSGVIQGWTIGVPLIGVGGEIKLVIPSSLAYGTQGRSPIPPNTPLYFDVKLTAVK